MSDKSKDAARSDRAVSTVEEFCAQHDLARSTFFRLRREDKAPRIMRVGRRVLITHEAAAAWRAKMEGLDGKAA